MSIYRIDQVEVSTPKAPETKTYHPSVYVDEYQLRLQGIYKQLCGETNYIKLQEFFWFDRSVVYYVLSNMNLDGITVGGLSFEFNLLSEFTIKNNLVKLILNSDVAPLVIEHDNGDCPMSRETVVHGLIPMLVELASLIGYNLELLDDVEWVDDPEEPALELCDIVESTPEEPAIVELELPEPTTIDLTEIPLRKGRGPRKSLGDIAALLKPYFHNEDPAVGLSISNVAIWNRMRELELTSAVIDDVTFVIEPVVDDKIVGYVNVYTSEWYVKLRVRPTYVNPIYANFASTASDNAADIKALSDVVKAVTQLTKDYKNA